MKSITGIREVLELPLDQRGSLFRMPRLIDWDIFFKASNVGVGEALALRYTACVSSVTHLCFETGT